VKKIRRLLSLPPHCFNCIINILHRQFSFLECFPCNFKRCLKPKIREDKGDSRKITGDIAVVIEEAVKQYPISSCAAIHRMLIAEGHIGIGAIAEGTVRKYIKEKDFFSFFFHKFMPQQRSEENTLPTLSTLLRKALNYLNPCRMP